LIVGRGRGGHPRLCVGKLPFNAQRGNAGYVQPFAAGQLLSFFFRAVSLGCRQRSAHRTGGGRDGSEWCGECATLRSRRCRPQPVGAGGDLCQQNNRELSSRICRVRACVVPGVVIAVLRW